MRIPRPVLIILLFMAVSVISVAVIIAPYQIKLSHARAFSNEQNKLMQAELLKPEDPESVKAIIQANITEEQAENTDTEFTSYYIVIDEEARVCRIDVEMAYGKHYDKFSTKELRF